MDEEEVFERGKWLPVERSVEGGSVIEGKPKFIRAGR